jgi:fatty acid amide hydrolase 2
MLPQVSAVRRQKLVTAARALGHELAEAIGDGVLLHPAHPRTAPRHGSTVGRPWLLTPAAVFNLAGVPVTEVPLGLSSRGLPLGVQIAAGYEQDHVSIAAALELERVFGGWVPPTDR